MGILNGLFGKREKTKRGPKTEDSKVSFIKDDVDKWISVLSDKDPKTREGAILHLIELCDHKAVEPLLEALNDNNNSVRSTAACAFSTIKTEKAVEPLIRLLRDKDEDARGNAALSLGWIGDKRAVDPLIKCMKDSHFWVRAKAAISLGKLKDIRAREVLTAATFDEHDVVKDYARDSISQLAEDLANDNVPKETMTSESANEKEWMCQKCDKRFMVPFDEHKRCMDSRERVFPTCTHCGGNYSMATGVVAGKESLPKWIEMKNPNVHIHNELALIREITFDGKGRASDKCCGNCREFTITLDDKHWCTKYSQEADQKDLCGYWFERKVFF